MVAMSFKVSKLFIFHKVSLQTIIFSFLYVDNANIQQGEENLMFLYIYKNMKYIYTYISISSIYILINSLLKTL